MPVNDLPAQPVAGHDTRELDASSVTRIHSLEKNLEENVDLIFRRSGYTTERKVWFNLRGNRRFEIAVVARKNTTRIAIEHHNSVRPAGIPDLSQFSEKLRLLCEERGVQGYGIFIAFPDLSPGSEQFASENTIETWGLDETIEQRVRSFSERLCGKGEILDLENALAANHDFFAITCRDLKNTDKISVHDARWTFHPYLRLRYHFEKQFCDLT